MTLRAPFLFAGPLTTPADDAIKMWIAGLVALLFVTVSLLNLFLRDKQYQGVENKRVLYLTLLTFIILAVGVGIFLLGSFILVLLPFGFN